jgi:hypothetical protein
VSAQRRAFRTPIEYRFAPDPCACPCGCREVMRDEEAAFFKGICMACGGGFHGLQASLRAAAKEEARP